MNGRKAVEKIEVDGEEAVANKKRRERRGEGKEEK